MYNFLRVRILYAIITVLPVDNVTNMKRQLNHFEAKAHDVQYRKRNKISYPLIEDVDTTETKEDRVAFFSILAIITFIIIVFIKL